jgi:hypothetical protein
MVIGQHWQEVDPRHPRIVTVIEFGEVYVRERVQEAGRYTMKRIAVPAVQIQCGNRRTWAQLKRFSGKRGGYKPAPTQSQTQND